MGQVAGRSEPIETGEKVQQSWRRIQDRLRLEVGPDVFEKCLSELRLGGLDQQQVVMTVSTAFRCKWVKDNYTDRLLQLWQHEYPTVIAVNFAVNESDGAAVRAKAPAPYVISGTEKAAPSEPETAEVADAFAETPALPEISAADVGLDARFTFQTFVAGQSNALAYEAARRVAETTECLYNPLYIHGGSGLGKTHLMQAIGNAILRTKPGRRVQFVHAEEFLSKFVAAVRAKDTLTFKDTYRSVDVLLIDDLHYIVDKQSTLEEMFNTLHALISARKQVVITADCMPAKLEHISERIKSWLGGGMVVDLPPTDYALRLDILKAKLAQHGTRRAATGLPVLTAGDGVLEFVAETVTQSVRDLEGALNRIVGQSEFLDVPMTLETVRPLFRDAVRPERPISLDDILHAASQYYEIKVSDIKSPRRMASLVRARHVGMWLSRDLTEKSFPQIALRFGGRDHTTVMSAVRKIEAQRRTDAALQSEIDDLHKVLRR